MMESEYFTKTNLVIRRVNKKLAKSFVEKHHYTHKVSLCKVAYGLYNVENTTDEWFGEQKQTLIGVVIYSHPVGRSTAESISEKLKIDEVLELIRLVILDGYGKNIESYFISKSIDLLKKDFSKIKCIVSYADAEQGHSGIIYQATNFLYQGKSSVALMPNYSVSLSPPPNYKWMHSRTVSSKYGSHNVEHLKKSIGSTFWRKKESSKHRYFLLICDKKERKQILKNLKHPTLSYPKKSDFSEEIEQIDVNPTNKEKEFFI